MNIVATNIVTAAPFLSGSVSEPVVQDCLETVGAVSSSRRDLKEQPLEDAEDSWFSAGSSFVKQGVHRAGDALTTTHEVIEAKPLPPGTSARTAAHTRALELSKEKKINIWTDSKCALGVVRAHGAFEKDQVY